MLLSHKHVRKNRVYTKKTNCSRKLFVSVIVPCYNEELTLGHCIESLIKQEFENYEILVVDDGSTDNTRKVGGKYANKYPNKISYICKENGGKASALNLGIKESKGDIVVCIDADSIFLPNTLCELIKPFQDDEVYAVGGNVKVANRNNVLSKHQTMEYISGLGLQRRSFVYLSCMQVISGAIGAFRKDVLLEIGGYSTDTIVEDMDITISIQKAGRKVAYNSNAIAYTEAPENITDFLKQRYRWTFGGFQVIRKHFYMLFNRKYGSLGVFGLPYFLFFPWVDVLISMLFFTSIIRVALYSNLIGFLIFYLGMVLLQSIILTYTLILDNENRRLALLSTIESLWYNHIISFITIRAGLNFIKGADVSWNKVARLGRNVVMEESLPVTSSVK